MIEFLIFFLVYTPIYSLIEVFYWDQVVRSYENQIARLSGVPERIEVKAMSFRTYWLVHPIPLLVGVFFLTYNIPLSIAMGLFYGVFQDYFYFLIVRRLGSDKWYTNQSWMEKWGDTNIPAYYVFNVAIALFFLILAGALFFYPVIGILGI